jgi:hypothetical protein
MLLCAPRMLCSAQWRSVTADRLGDVDIQIADRGDEIAGNMKSTTTVDHDEGWTRRSEERRACHLCDYFSQ